MRTRRLSQVVFDDSGFLRIYRWLPIPLQWVVGSLILFAFIPLAVVAVLFDFTFGTSSPWRRR